MVGVEVLNRKCLLFVTGIDWKQSPSQEEDNATVKQEPGKKKVNVVEDDDFRSIKISRDLVDKVMEECIVSLAYESQRFVDDEDGKDGHIVRILSNPSIGWIQSQKPHQYKVLMKDKHNAVIVNRNDPLRVNRHLTEKAKIYHASTEDCECRGFGYEKCVAEIMPVDEVDTVDLFRQINARLYGRVTVGCFEDLPNRLKRWFLYWSYAVNVFHFRTAAAEPLPKCFELAVHKTYPDPAGKYTGFKSTKKRKAEKVQ